MPVPHLRSRGLASLLVVFALGACEEPSDDTTAEAGDDPEPLTCEDDERAEAFTVDLAKTGERHTVKIVEATPAEPARGDNTWTVELLDGDGNPEDGATMDLRPWMPDHGHGSPVEEEVTDLGGGEYEIKSLNLFMPGLWQVTFDLSDASDSEDAPDEVMFSICIL
jgi:hypothetical protein